MFDTLTKGRKQPHEQKERKLNPAVKSETIKLMWGLPRKKKGPSRENMGEI